MSNTECEIGMIGLGVMGRNLALNMADHGFRVAGYDRGARGVRCRVPIASRYMSRMRDLATPGAFDRIRVRRESAQYRRGAAGDDG